MTQNHPPFMKLKRNIFWCFWGVWPFFTGFALQCACRVVAPPLGFREIPSATVLTSAGADSTESDDLPGLIVCF